MFTSYFSLVSTENIQNWSKIVIKSSNFSNFCTEILFLCISKCFQCILHVRFVWKSVFDHEFMLIISGDITRRRSIVVSGGKFKMAARKTPWPILRQWERQKY